jgi:hypothetical protein
MSRRFDAKRRCDRAQTIRVLAVVLLLGALASVTISGTHPVGALRAEPGGGLLSCSYADSTNGVRVSWGSLAIEADTVRIERSADDGVTFEQRGRSAIDRGEWIDDDLTDLVPDGQTVTPLDQATSSNQYRIVVVRNGETVSTAPCSWDRGNTGRFECSVAVDDDGYLVEWVGGPSGAGLDYVVERFVDRGEGSRFHWRARRFDRSFLDGGADRFPTYRVTARFDRKVAVSVECGVDGVMGVRLPNAAFVCPAPGATFVDTFGADRDGGARRHRGVDMFAPVGTPVLAPESGDLVFFWNELGGRSFGLHGESGTFYYGAHLDSFAGGDRWVVAGELVGTIGNTGNARTTPPHLHFQIHPDGRRTPAANPTAATVVACS